VRNGEKRAGKTWRKASDQGERVAIVVPPRSEEMFVLWAAKAITWCRRLVCSCSGCCDPTKRSYVWPLLVDGTGISRYDLENQTTY